MSNLPPRPPTHRDVLKVVHCIDNFEIGGTELNAVRTLELLAPRRFDLSLVALQETGPLRERYERMGIPIQSFCMPSFYSSLALRRASQLFRWLVRVRPHIVHCHDLYTNMFVAPLARLAGVPLTITSRRWCDQLLPSRLHLLANRFAYAISHVVVANSDILADALIKNRNVRAGKVVVIKNFVDDVAFELLASNDRARARGLLGIPSDAIVAVAVARFRPEKNLVALVRSSAQVAAVRPDFHVLLIGSGPCEEELRSAASALGIANRVHFAGLQMGPPNPHQLGEFSVLCSLHEGSPNSILEAMAVGNPVIATAVGGVPDLVEHNRNGILIAPGSVDELAHAVARLSSSAPLRKQLGDAGRERIKAHHSAARILAEVSHLYEYGNQEQREDPENRTNTWRTQPADHRSK